MLIVGWFLFHKDSVWFLPKPRPVTIEIQLGEAKKTLQLLFEFGRNVADLVEEIRASTDIPVDCYLFLKELTGGSLACEFF
jgi:hypothetical protein